MTRFDKRVEAQLREIVELGVTSFKVFMTYDKMIVSDEMMLDILVAVLADGLPAVEAACAEGLAQAAEAEIDLLAASTTVARSPIQTPCVSSPMIFSHSAATTSSHRPSRPKVSISTRACH